MRAIIDNITALLPFVLIPWALFIFATIRGKQRFRNSFLLMIALLMTMFFLAAFFGENMVTALLIEIIVICVAVLVVPFFLIFNGIVMRKREGGSLANQMSLIMGILILLGEAAMIWFALRSTQYNSLNNFDKICCLVGYSALYFCLIFLCFMFYVISIQVFPHKYDYKFIIIHGCGLIDGCKVSKLLSQRIDTAINTFRKCMKKGEKKDSNYGGPIIIPSGGRGSDESMSEAAAMKGYLLDHGIPEKNILVEDASETSEENLINSKNIIQARGGGRVALVTSNYHVYRCLILAKSIGLECTGIGSPVAFYFWPSALIREFVAVFSQRKKALWLSAFWLVLMLMFISVLW